MCPGSRPATGCIANLTFIPLDRRILVISAMACCALATAIPYPGTIITLLALVSVSTTSSAVTVVTFISCGWPEDTPIPPPRPLVLLAVIPLPPVSPKPPTNTLTMDRFIARHMTNVKIIPEQPTNAPAITNALFTVMNPAAEVLNPERLFKKLMETGISPPPIAMTAIIPQRQDANATSATMATPSFRSFQVRSPPTKASILQITIPAANTNVHTQRKGGIRGLESIIPCNFKTATQDPVNVMQPITMDKIMAMACTQSMALVCKKIISAAAPPPPPPRTNNVA
mmetsp:Transcript_14921/g.28093  ORF Transcript_14921/g.28093 Transcript_14921/m.28093 type:complete len:285 (+) Transcript_14921:755-1609(+)